MLGSERNGLHKGKGFLMQKALQRSLKAAVSKCQQSLNANGFQMPTVSECQQSPIANSLQTPMVSEHQLSSNNSLQMPMISEFQQSQHANGLL